jgi:hypothetical protein
MASLVNMGVILHQHSLPIRVSAKTRFRIPAIFAVQEVRTQHIHKWRFDISKSEECESICQVECKSKESICQLRIAFMHELG